MAQREKAIAVDSSISPERVEVRTSKLGKPVYIEGGWCVQSSTPHDDFLAAFYPDPDEEIHLRALKPKGVPVAPYNRPRKLRITRARLAADLRLWQRLKTLNSAFGLYFVVNAGGDKDEDIRRFNAWFVERDEDSFAEQHQSLDLAPLPPSIRVETRKSVHAYWLISGDCDARTWREIQCRLIAHFRGDDANKNASRVMRLPHFNHLHLDTDTNTVTPKCVELVSFDSARRYTVEEMLSAFPPVSQPPVTKTEDMPRADVKDTKMFSTWDDLNAELKRRIMQHPTARINGDDWFHCRGLCHNGRGDTAIMFNPATGAVKCMNGCSHKDVLRAFGLPEYPLSNSLIRNSCDTRKAYPVLDSKALYGLAGEFVNTILPVTEADGTALLLQMLVGFGNIIGRKPYFVAESTRHYMNLYLLVVGSTSSAKGSSLSQVLNVLSRVDEGWAQKCNKSGLSSGEGLIEAVGETDKRLFLRETEFVSVLARQYRDASVLSATLRGLWDEGNSRVMNRRQNALSTTDAHVSLVGHITPEELTQRLNTTDLWNGYANRFLFAYVRRSKDLPDSGKVSERQVKTLKIELLRAQRFAEGIAEMDRDDEAKELWRAVYPRLVEDRAGVFGKVIARARAQVLRLSCLYALLDRSAIVGRVHLEAALALWQYCEDSARYIFAEGIALSAHAQRLLDAVREAGDIGLTRTAQSGVFRGNLTAKQLDTLTDELIKARLVRFQEATDGGRKPNLVAAQDDELTN